MRRANDIWRVLFGVPEAASRHVARDQSGRDHTEKLRARWIGGGIPISVPCLHCSHAIPFSCKYSAVASKGAGSRVGSAGSPRGTQITIPRRARVRSTRYLLVMLRRPASTLTPCHDPPRGFLNSQLPLAESKRKSPPQQTQVQSSSSPWHSNSLAATSRRLEDRESSVSLRNQSV